MASEKRLDGAAKYLVPKDDRARYEERDALVIRANDTADLRVMLNDLGADIPEDAVTSWKAHCPFGAEHSDGGIEKAMRYYPESNSAYCFAAHGILTPVRVLALSEGISQHKAAQRLVGAAGIRYGWRERFREVQEEASRPGTASPAYAITALHVRIQTHPNYLRRQFDDDFRAAWEGCMERLEGVGNEFDAFMGWVEGSVRVLAQVLESE